MQQKTGIILAAIAILTLLVGCATPFTGKAVTNITNSTKPEKFTVPDEPVIKENKNATQTCAEQIADLKKQKTKDEYDLLQLKGEQQKVALELQYKKENNKFKEEVERLINQLRIIGKDVDILKDDIDSKKDAIRLLEEKCDMKTIGVQ